MNHLQDGHSLSGRWLRRTFLAVVVLLFLVAVAYSIAGKLGAFVGPRPMFCHNIGPTRGFFPGWQLDGLFSASDGSVAYVDTGENIIVLIYPDVPGYGANVNRERWLFDLEDGDVAIPRSKKNSLYLLRRADNHEVLNISADTALAVFEALQSTNPKRGYNREPVWPIVAGFLKDDENRSRFAAFAPPP